MPKKISRRYKKQTKGRTKTGTKAKTKTKTKTKAKAKKIYVGGKVVIIIICWHGLSSAAEDNDRDEGTGCTCGRSRGGIRAPAKSHFESKSTEGNPPRAVG